MGIPTALLVKKKNREGDHRWLQKHLSSAVTNTVDFSSNTCLKMCK
jgi:hypothetical protein